jgi:hypothetical protein
MQIKPTNQKLLDKEDHHLMTKGSIHQEDIAVVGIYTSNIRAP